jgi:hypothetical protein
MLTIVLYVLDAIADILATMILTGKKASRLAIYFTFWCLL